MKKSIIEIVIGDLSEKKEYRQLMKRVKALPESYCFAFKKIQHYMYSVGTANCDMTMFTDLVELFEESARENKDVLDVIGSDVAAFCDELIHVSSGNATTPREKLNQEILNYFYGEGSSHDSYY